MGSRVFITVVVPLSILLPILMAIIHYKHFLTPAKKVFYYLVFSGVINIAATIVGRFFHKNNFPIVHVYTPIELAIIVWFYVDILDLRKYKKMIVLLLALFALLCVLNSIFFQSIYTYNSYARSIEAMICMLFALNFYAKMAAEERPTKHSALFNFNTAFFLYFSGAFMLFVFSNFSVWNLSNSDFRIIWVIHGVLLIIQYIFFTIGFIYAKSNR